MLSISKMNVYAIVARKGPLCYQKYKCIHTLKTGVDRIPIQKIVWKTSNPTIAIALPRWEHKWMNQ